MSAPDLKHLFTPGTGAVPPYLAGRKQEQEYFRDCVEVLKGRNSVSRDLILYGPRGNGKTALLRYLQTKTRQEEGDRLDILWVTPNTMSTETEFAHLLSGPKKLKNRFKKLTGSVGAWVASAGIEMDLSGSLSIAEHQIREKCKRKPFILIIDEAHTLAPALARTLLNASQSVRNAGNPFLLVLAGNRILKPPWAKPMRPSGTAARNFPWGVCHRKRLVRRSASHCRRPASPLPPVSLQKSLHRPTVIRFSCKSGESVWLEDWMKPGKQRSPWRQSRQWRLR